MAGDRSANVALREKIVCEREDRENDVNTPLPCCDLILLPCLAAYSPWPWASGGGGVGRAGGCEVEVEEPLG